MRKLILIPVIVSIFAATSVSCHAADTKNNNKETLKLLDMFGDIFEKVREEYVEEPSDKQLLESAINGMLTDLDPHSAYLNEQAFAEMQVQTKGEFGGLGIEVTLKDGMVYIVSPIDDTPAFKAGLQAGDYISHIDGDSVIGMQLSDAVKKMRGAPGTDINLTILREGADEAFDVKITRDVIKIKSVRSQAEGDVIYARITSFSEETEENLEDAIKKHKKEIGKNLKGVVLDLRNNPGGLLTQAISVSDLFLEQGEIVSTRGRLPSSTKRFNATRGDIIDGLPMVVLINGGSASASEIVSGALKDHKRAIIIGTKSFGKGSVQTVIPLPHDSAMRLTTSLYYTPSGTSIQAQGIQPDIIVEQAKVEFVKSGKRTTEASLRGHIENGGKKESGDEDNNEKKKDTNEAEKNKDSGDEKESLYKKDYQLARALDLLRGLYIFKSQSLEH